MASASVLTPSAMPAFVGRVNDDRNVRLPESVPAGAMVTVIVMPSEAGASTASSTARYDGLMAAIHDAIARGYDGSGALSIEDILAISKAERKNLAD